MGTNFAVTRLMSIVSSECYLSFSNMMILKHNLLRFFDLFVGNWSRWTPRTKNDFYLCMAFFVRFITLLSVSLRQQKNTFKLRYILWVVPIFIHPRYVNLVTLCISVFSVLINYTYCVVFLLISIYLLFFMLSFKPSSSTLSANHMISSANRMLLWFHQLC